MSKFPPIPIELDLKTQVGTTGVPSDSGELYDTTSEYFLQSKPLDIASVASSVNIRLPLYRTSKNYQSGMWSLEGLYRDGDSDTVADFIVKTGAINKALKYAMLYNFFGYPVANIVLESKSDFSANSYESYEFSSQNLYDYKPNLYGFTYASYNKGNGAFDIYSTYQANGIATKQVYQFGKIGNLPDFGSINSYDDLKSFSKNNQANFKSYQDLDNKYNFSLSYNIFKHLHADESAFTGYYAQSFVDMIGFSPEASVFYANENNSLFLYRSMQPLQENLDNGKLFGSYKNGIAGEQLEFSSEWGNTIEANDVLDLETEVAEQILNANEKYEDIRNQSFEKLFGNTETQYGFGQNKAKNSLLNLVNWAKYNNPITKTYCRAWLPSLQGARNLNIGYEEVKNDLETYMTVYAQGGDAVAGATAGYSPEYSRIFDKSYADENLTFKGSSDYDINTLGMILGQYGASSWYKYLNSEGLIQETALEDLDPSWASEDPLSVTYDKFARDNIASQYKLVPGTSLLGTQTALLANQELGFYKENPARTLNAIMPYIMNYITKVIPSWTPDAAADDWKSPNDYPNNKKPSNNINMTDVITEANNPNITPKDFLRKFRFSTQDMTSYSSDDLKQGLGYTHRIGDLGSSGESLGISQARNRLTLCTTSVAQREYLTYNSLTRYDWQDPYLDQYVRFLPFDKNFLYSPSNPVIKTMFVNANGSKKLAEMTIAGSSEISINSIFSLFALSQMYMKLPPYYKKSAEMEGYYANEFGNELSFSVEFTPDMPDNPSGTDKEGAFNFALLSANNVSANLSTIGATIYQDGFKMYEPATALGGVGYLTFPVENFGVGSGITNTIAYLKSIGDIDVKLNPPIGNSNTSIGSVTIKSESDLTLPVWNYAKKDLDLIEWKLISSDEEKIADLQKAINNNEQIASAINYGIPKWVHGLRVYPTIDSDTTISNLSQPEYSAGLSVVLSNNQAPIASSDETQYTLTNYKTSNSENIKYKAAAALKLVIEPEIDGSTELINNNAGAPEQIMHRAYAEMKYAVEIDIDEKELILDLAAQGIIAFAGSVEEYENLGFDVETLITVANGNIASPSLKNLADSIQEGIDIANSGYNFGNWPGLIAEGKGFEYCLDITPPEVVQKVLSIKATESDPYVCTSYICLNETGAPSTPLKISPGKDAKNIGYLSDKTVVKVLKEWVNGKGEFNKVIVTDKSSQLSGSIGFINPKLLKSVKIGNSNPIFFEEIFAPLSLAETKVEARSEMAEALNPSWWKIPLNSLAETSEPYLYIQDGEIHYPVTLDADCIVDDSDLDSLRNEAKIKGVKELFAYFDKIYTEETVEKFISSYLAVRVEKDDYYLDPRPGSKVIMLLKVGGVYLNAIESGQQNLENLKNIATKKISLNTGWYQAHLQQAVYGLNKLYNDMTLSPYTVKGFNFFKEAKRLSYVPVILKKMLAVNGFNTNPQEENTINVGFDDGFNLIYVSYREKGSKEKLLNIGLQHFKNSEPFVFSNTMSLFYHHREMRNPLLKWQVIFKEWLPNPKPQIVSSDNTPSPLAISKCSPYFDWTSPSLSKIWDNALGQLAELLDLDPRYDLGAFQFNLLQYFPPCPRPAAGKGPGILNFTNQINGQSRIFSDGEIIDGVVGEVNRFGEYIGDWLSSGEALKDIQTKIFDIDDLYHYVLNYITPELLYSKICKCFIDLMDVEEISVPNLQMSADFGSGGMSLNPESFTKNQNDGVTKDFVEFEQEGYNDTLSTQREVLRSEDLFCSFCFRMPSIFLRLPSSDILSELVNAIKAALEFAIAQILMQLIKALIEILLTCPEIKCGPEENVGRVEDFGALNLNDVMSGVDFDNCGLLIDGFNITNEDVQSMLLDVSNSLTTTEVLSILDGTASSPVMRSINMIVSKYPAINAVLSNPAMIEDFFVCAGENIDNDYLNELLDNAAEQFSDPSVCINIQEEAKQKLIDKCGNIQDINKLIQKTYNHDIEKYKKIARIIRDNDNLSNQLPPLFTDGKGTQSILSGIKFDTLDYALDQIIDTNSIPIESQLNIDTSNFFNPLANQYIKSSEVSYLYNLPDRQFFVFEAIFVPDQSNSLAGLNVKNQEGTFDIISIDKIAFDMESYTKTGDYELKFSAMDDSIYVSYKLNKPKTLNGSKIFSNNFTLNAKRTLNVKSNNSGNSEIKTIESNFGEKEFAPDIKDLLESGDYELFSNTVPEQVQTFSNMLKNAGGLSEFLGSKNSEQFAELYSSIFSGLINGINESIKENTLLETYRVDPSTKVGPDELEILAVLLLVAFPPPNPTGIALAANPDMVTDVIDNSYPKLLRQQLENINLNSLPIKNSNQGPIPSAIIDFEKMKKDIKDAYDFSKEADQKSDSIQAPQKAFLYGYAQGFMQVFAGQVFAKTLHFLPFFPQQIFTNNSNLLIDYIFETFEADWLNKKASDTFRDAWKKLVCRLIAEKPEFKPDTGYEKLPHLPGEDPQNYGPTAQIKGSIYDMNLGYETRVENWRDATKYIIRQSYESPLSFIKNQLSNTQLSDNKLPSSEISPLDFIAFKDILPIHDKSLNFEGDKVEIASKSASLFGIPNLNDAKSSFSDGGRFFFQYYIELEELDPFVDLGTFQDENFYVEKNIEKNELYNEQFINRPNELKGKLSPRQFARLIELLIPAGKNSQMGFGYDNQYKSRRVKDFFKSIKIGVRMCFGIAHDKLETDQKLKNIYNNLVEIYKNNLLNIAGAEAIAEALGATQEEIEASYDSIKAFINFIQRDKSFIIFEDVKTEFKFTESTEEGVKILGDFKQTEISEAFFESSIAYQTDAKIDESGLMAYDIEVLISTFDANVSFVFPLISKDQEIRNNPSFKDFFNKKLNDICENPSLHEDFLENITKIVNRPSSAALIQQLLEEIAFSQEYRLLFSYVFPIPEIINMYLIFFNLAVDTDPSVRNAFENTKKVMASTIESIYNMRGKDAYKIQPPLIEKSGGPKGIAQGASSGFNKN